MKSLLSSLLLIAGSVLISFVLVEGLVRLFFPQDRLVTWIEMNDLGFMQNQSGGEFFQERDGRRAEYLLDQNGLRVGVDDAFHQRKNGSHQAETGSHQAERVLVLGDSFTFGLLLEESDTFIQRWEEMLAMDQDRPGRSFRLLNAGVGGAGLADWPLWLEEYGPGLQPDWVIYVMNTADVERALSKNLFVLDEESGMLQTSQRWKPRRFFRSLGRNRVYQWIQAHSEFVNRFTTFLWKSVYFEDLTGDLQQEKARVPIPSEEQFSMESAYSLDLSLAILDRMRTWCEGQGCRLMGTTTGFFMEGEAGLHTQRVYEALTQPHQPVVPFFDITPCVVQSVAQSTTVDVEENMAGSVPGDVSGDASESMPGDVLQSVPEDKSGDVHESSDEGSPDAGRLGTESNILDRIRIPGDSHPDELGAAIIARCLHQVVSPELRSNSINPKQETR